MITLAVHAQQLDARIAALEARLARPPENLADQPSPDSLAGLRADTARVAAEVSRLTINLYARYDSLTERQDALDRWLAAPAALIDLAEDRGVEPAWRASA